MISTRKLLLPSLAGMLLGGLLNAQQSVSLPSTGVPRLVNFSGRAVDAEGKTLAGIAGVTFAIYADQSGGAPLWMETQNAQADTKGNYTVQLGSTKSEGLPLDLFASGAARWLGVTINGGQEQPRILLLSVPYALKAADAETVGGLPPSAFMLATPPAGGHTSVTATQVSHASPPAPPPASSNVTTTGGTVNALPLFATATSIQNSLLTQVGTTAVYVAGKLNLPATGKATGSAGKNSHPATMVASSFNNSTNAAVNQTFQLQAEPAGNDTSSPSGTLNLLYGSGTTAPVETGLKVSSTGAITASGLAIGTSKPAQALDLGTNNNMVIRVDPGKDTTQANGGYALIGRGAGGVANTWWTYTAPVGGGFGIPANSYSVWQYPPNSKPGCCLNRLAILPALASTDTGSTVTIDQNGNMDQARSAGGIVKAMILFSPFSGGRFVQCYNSTLSGAAATTPPCGFTYDVTGASDYVFDLGFQIDDRFISATVQQPALTVGACTDISRCNNPSVLTPDRVEVTVYAPVANNYQDDKLNLIVY